VVERVGDLHGDDRFVGRQADFEIKADRLRQPRLPAVDADRRRNAQVVDEDRVHRGSETAGRLQWPESVPDLRRSSVLAAILIVIAASLIGSVSFAVVVSRAFGLPDPHEYGSGNPGATNVLRTGNKAAAASTLAGGGARGGLAVLGAQLAAPAFGAPDGTVPAAALAVFLGHLFPVF